MTLLVLDDVLEELPGCVVRGLEAETDARPEDFERGHLQAEIALELVPGSPAHGDTVIVGHVGHALEEEDPLDDLVGVLHLVDRLLVVHAREDRVAPVPAHYGSE